MSGSWRSRVKLNSLAVLCLVSLLCYFIIWKILLAYFNLEPQYIVGFLNIDMLLKDGLVHKLGQGLELASNAPAF
jgi:hypothetical protein